MKVNGLFLIFENFFRHVNRVRKRFFSRTNPQIGVRDDQSLSADGFLGVDLIVGLAQPRGSLSWWGGYV